MTILKYNNNHVWRLNRYYRTEIKGESISTQYERTMDLESSAIDPYFTADTLNHVLEIGPGMGVFSALLHKKYGPSLYLIDGSGGDAPDYEQTIGWRGKNPTPCADIEAMRSFMFENGIIDFEVLELLPPCVNGQDPEYRMIRDDKPDLDATELEDAWTDTRFDLVVSLRSWCWHYDADLYLKFVADRCIPHHTLLLVDIRRDNGQPEKLYKHFSLVKEIETNETSWKMARLLMRAK